MPRKKKKIYKNIVLRNVKSYDDLPSDIAIRIERGVGGRRTFRYVDQSICTDIREDNDENKPWGYVTIAKPSDGLVADRFRVNEFEYHLWNHLLGNLGGDLITKPIAPCANKSSKVWAERLSIEEDDAATSFTFSSESNMMKDLLKSKRIC